ncbi:MAG: 2-hydroxyacyl-CoA dehydratase [Deltaproteobacteria bacterium]|nr:2-hydroxyacyl-CoA dehydratase [Deltaproteobacteria bacterium]
MRNRYLSGIDIGSTTVKIALCKKNGDIAFVRYCRHNAMTVDTVCALLNEAQDTLGDVIMDLAITGSAGMGVAETCGLPFVQEVVASANYIRHHHSDVRTFIEIGGEDSKILFFDDEFRPDIRMNGNCAGGTGAFIDQMAVLLNIPLCQFNHAAEESTTLYPIASRCGVFAKTDVQSLLSNNVSVEDIAASVFHAITLQVIATLARGCQIHPKILFAGGPLTFFPQLQESFIRVLELNREKDIVVCHHPEALTAIGTAFYPRDKSVPISINDCIQLLKKNFFRFEVNQSKKLPALFADSDAFDHWRERHDRHKVERIDLSELRRERCYLGIDSGSTTTKMVLIDEGKQVALTYYASNQGDPVGAVRRGLKDFHKRCIDAKVEPTIHKTAVTGYGESLIKAAFGIDEGIVETMAHYRAAKHFNKDVSFVLDIGGQDMKALYIKDGFISDIQINEACSSGCGSFIETFAVSMGYHVSDFARLALNASQPFDLGTRCTVFMNSKVKQALREGASTADISAGLAYSVIKNSLYKVLKLRDPATLGDQIVAQGGTFKNPAVLRAFEKILEKDVICPDMAELMGAFGAALTALNSDRHNEMKATKSTSFGELIKEKGNHVDRKILTCKGCENRCRVIRLMFDHKRYYHTGNRCERHFSNSGSNVEQGENLIQKKLTLLFDRRIEPDHTPILNIGLPRALNMYENFPFWCAFFNNCGFKVTLSDPSDMKLFEKGVGTVMSDNVCFPAKLVHGHILNLIQKKVDRIFYPLVVYEKKETNQAFNSYNCPIVTGYPDVVSSAFDPESQYGIPIDRPAVSFENIGLLKKQLSIFLKSFGIPKRRVEQSVEKALEAQRNFKQRLKELAAGMINNNKAGGRLTVALCGRPYHIDPLINHGIPELLTSLGMDVVSEDMITLLEEQQLDDSNVLTQWAYSNRILSAAKYVSRRDNMEMVQLTSFGCGLDAISTDEAKDIIQKAGKIYSLIKIDEIANIGAARIRLRSMLEAFKEQKEQKNKKQKVAISGGRTVSNGREMTIIVPWVSPFYSPLLPTVFKAFNYRVELLLPQEESSVEVGLKYVNNDMCYPAVIVIGDIVKAFMSGRYDPHSTAVMLTQTFGQCRASNYLPLTQKALALAGFADIPVLSVSAEDTGVHSGLTMEKKNELIKRLGIGLLFSDAMAQMYLASAAREIHKGETDALHKKYMLLMEKDVGDGNFRNLLQLLKDAVMAFNRIECCTASIPCIGILGEIFVKYNSFSNNNIVEWLIDHDIEVFVPSLMEFFTQRFVNEAFNQSAYLKRSLTDRFFVKLLDLYVQRYTSQVEKVMRDFRFYRKNHELKELAAAVTQVTSLANQAGEGWLLTAEMISMLKNGISNIICLQPFGCLANHITGKGIEKRLKKLYPQLNLLFLDMDAGSSEVNILNRLHFMLMTSRERMKLTLQGKQNPELLPALTA